MRRHWLLIVVISSACTGGSSTNTPDLKRARFDPIVIDLTRAIPTFISDPTDPTNLANTALPSSSPPPLADAKAPSQAAPTPRSAGRQAILFPNPTRPITAAGGATKDYGNVSSSRILFDEHSGTHLDSPIHFAAAFPSSIEVPMPDRRTAELLTGEDLVGPVVVIDISSRVMAAIADNPNGMPDPSKPEFGYESSLNVTAADIDAVADRLGKGVFLVIHTGWGRYWDMTSNVNGPYANVDFTANPVAYDYPGLSPAAVARLIEIEDAMGFRINGIAADNLTVDCGAGFGAFELSAHWRGLQRGWKLIENLADTDLLAEMSGASCTLVAGALKHVNGTGSASRVLALCEQ